MRVRVIVPPAYVEISFGCSERRFIEVKNNLKHIAAKFSNDDCNVWEEYFVEEYDVLDLKSVTLINSATTVELIDYIKEDMGITQYIEPGRNLVFTV